VEFRCGTLFDSGLEDGAFGAVLGLNVLHLLPDRRASIRRAWQLLAPGGVFITSTACLSGLWRLLWPVLRLGSALGRVPRVWFFRREQLEKEMTECGFTIVERLPPPRPGGGLFLIARKP
jgi:SAM-dependent methyltransferase